MAENVANDYHVDISRGRIRGASIVHKFGHNEGIGTTYVPISDDGIYQTPTSLTSLELVSSDANDSSAGTGARTVIVEGIGENWEEVSETVTLNGITAVALTTDFLRVYRMYVETSGTYATQSAGSHVGILTLRVAGAGAEWASIQVSGFPLGQTEIGAYTVPAGKVAFIRSVHIHVDSAKAVDITAFRRDGADAVVAPFSPMRTWGQYHGVAGATDLKFEAPVGPFPACSDIGFMGKVASGTGSALVDFEILLFNT